MSEYTEKLNDKANDMYEVLPEDDNYREELVNIVQSFRNFDEALDSFIQLHGFYGNIHDTEEKVTFLRERFQTAGVPVPRGLRDWYLKHKKIDKQTAIQLCFAFDLTVDEAQDFLRRIYLKRTFDYHNPKELLLYFALLHKCKYSEVEPLLKAMEVPKDLPMPENDVLFTSVIIEDVKTCSTINDVYEYILNNPEQFGYNNATAYKYIKARWDDIRGPQGLAAKEERQFDYVFHEDIVNNTRVSKGSRSKKESSNWGLYLQIVGLKGQDLSKFETDRSIKPIMRNNELIHPLVEDSFPDRDGLEKVLNGKHVSEERVRKLLILVVFYWYWVKKELESRSLVINPSSADYQDFIALVNRTLGDSNYPELYAGNPYDWIILYASLDEENPLRLFRRLMYELLMSKKELLSEEIDQ